MPGEGYLQPSLGLAHHWRSADADETMVVLAFQQLKYGGQDLQRIMNAGLYHGQPLYGQTWQPGQLKCSMLYGVEWKSLTYPTVDIINGQYFGVAASMGCSQAVGWSLLAHAGLDRAESQRPGGDQQQADLRAQLFGRLGASQWMTEIGIAHLRDTEGYSQLLDNNGVRDIWRGSLTLEYAYPLSVRLQGLARVEAFRQDSSLALFDTRGKAAWLGVRYGF